MSILDLVSLLLEGGTLAVVCTVAYRFGAVAEAARRLEDRVTALEEWRATIMHKLFLGG